MLFGFGGTPGSLTDGGSDPQEGGSVSPDLGQMQHRDLIAFQILLSTEPNLTQMAILGAID